MTDINHTPLCVQLYSLLCAIIIEYRYTICLSRIILCWPVSTHVCHATNTINISITLRFATSRCHMSRKYLTVRTCPKPNHSQCAFQEKGSLHTACVVEELQVRLATCLLKVTQASAYADKDIQGLHKVVKRF